MRVRILGLFGILMLGIAPAMAGGGTGYSHSVEKGVHVFKGQHAPIVSHQDLERAALQKQRQAEQEQAEMVQRLRAQIDAQSAQIDQLNSVVSDLKTSTKTRGTRRRVFYGNPRFFGSNGFIGNRYYGGATVQLPKKPYRAHQTD